MITFAWLCGHWPTGVRRGVSREVLIIYKMMMQARRVSWVSLLLVVVLLFCFDGSGSFSKRALVTDLRADRCRRFLARGRLCRRRCYRYGSIVLRIPFGRGVRPALDAARIGRSVHLCLAIKSALGHLVLQSFGFAQQTERLLARYLTCRASVCLECRLRRASTSQ